MNISTSKGGAKASRRMRYVPAGCPAVIGIPLSLAGLLALVLGLLGVFPTSEPWSEMGDPATTGGILTAIGLGLLFLAGRRFVRIRSKAQLEDQHPGKPWMWREDWASGRIKDSHLSDTAKMWVFGIAWIAFWGSLAVLVLQQEPPRHPATWLVLIVPLIGILLLWVAISQTAARRKFGTSHLQLVTHPGVIGRQFRATLETNLKEVPADGIEVTLSNIRQITIGVQVSHKQQSSTHHTRMWEETITVPPSRLSLGMNGVTVPLAFNIPLDAEPSDDLDPYNRVLWVVYVSASLPGIDYRQSFEVPVFITGDTPV